MISVKLFAIIVLVGSAVSFRLDSSGENEDRIVGGRTARPGQFPHQASVRGLTRLPNGQMGIGVRCSGGIISNRWVLTVATCTQNQFADPANTHVVVGAHHISSDGTRHQLSRIVRHPTYNNRTYINDIALLQTTAPIQFNNLVRAIPLRRQFLGAGEVGTHSGWGVTRAWPQTWPTHLQFLNVRTMTNEGCRRSHNSPIYDNLITNTTLCVAQGGFEGGCVGDSGNPLVLSGQLVGLLSWRRGCSGYPNAFTRVSELAGWIQQTSGVAAV